MAPLWLIHYGIKRSETLYLLGLYVISWLAYLKCYSLRLSFSHIMILAVLSRFLLFWGFPSLSDDFYRFLWDGKVTAQGINPFAETPKNLLDKQVYFPADPLLYDRLNSKEYYTIYPAISQFIFYMAGLPDSILGGLWILRLIIFVFDIGTIYLLALFFANTSRHKVALYALNPLVILELTGNLHLEGIMLFFILLAITLIERNRWKSGALAIACGTLVKFNPLMYLPVFINKIGWKRSIGSYLIIMGTAVVLSIPLIDREFAFGLSQSVPLFFEKFEFNSGLFFLIRQVGYWLVGFDIVYLAGPILSGLALCLILWISFAKTSPNTSLSYVFTIILTIQLFLSTTVHPWYIIPLIAFSVATGYRFPILWSLMAFLSYVGYTPSGYDHPIYFIYLEYLSVAFLAWRELIMNRRLT